MFIKKMGRNKKKRGSSLPKYDDCDSCKLFSGHIQMAIEAREHYKQESKKDVNTDEIIMSVDLQKVLMLPRLPGLKIAIFCKRLVAFNESFVPVGQKNGK